MPFSVETKDRDKPIVLFFGDQPFIEKLINKYSEDFKIAYVSDKSIEEENLDNFYRIKKSSANLVKNLEENIDYAVLFLDQENRVGTAPLFEKIKEDATKTVVLIPYAQVDKFYDLIQEYKSISHLRFLLIGDIYAESGEYLKTEIGDIIKEAFVTKALNITGNDLTPIFPIYLNDAIKGVGQVLFSSSLRDKFYNLFYSHPVTLISAVHVLTRAEPDLEIKYGEPKDHKTDKKPFEEIRSNIKARLFATPEPLDKYLNGFEKSLAKFDAGELAKIPKEPIEKITEIPKKIVPEKVRPSRKQANVFGRAIFISLALFIIFNFVFIAISALQLKSAVNAFKNNDYQKVSSNIKIAKNLLEISKPTISLLAKGAGFFGIKQVEASFDKAQSGINLFYIAMNDITNLQNLETGLDRETLDNLIADANYVYFQGEKEKATLESDALNTIITPDLSSMASILQVAPLIFGYQGEKNYLILFQNNGELRPTGGFIGSVGEAKFSGGKLEDFNIQDVYEYDGQLVAHVEPHFIVRRYLQPHLYLRDSNFGPDFQESAAAAAQIYNLETGKKVDGVIAINFEAVREIIKEIGPIKLSKYDKVIDENNAFEFLQSTIDDNFFPGSTAKKDVLQALYNQITLKFEEDPASFVKVAHLVPQLMIEKDILFAFSQNEIQSAFSANDFGGDIADNRVGDSIKDFLAINEANIGVNKANIGVSRETSYDLALNNGKIESKVTHTLFNGNEDNNYRAYLRLYTPRGSGLKSIVIDGVVQDITTAIEDFRIYEAENFTPPEGLEVDTQIEGDFRTFGFIVNVPAKSKSTIEITYNNGVSVPNDDVVTYSLKLIKQPGTQEFPFKLTFDYGDELSPKEIVNATLENNKVIIADKITRDKEYNMEFVKR